MLVKRFVYRNFNIDKRSFIWPCLPGNIAAKQLNTVFHITEAEAFFFSCVYIKAGAIIFYTQLTMMVFYSLFLC